MITSDTIPIIITIDVGNSPIRYQYMPTKNIAGKNIAIMLK